MKLNLKQTFFVGLAFLSICSFWQVYDGIIPLILKNTFHLNDAVAGVIMALDNMLALFMLPLLGMVSDKTSTRIGRRMPFIVYGTAVAAVLMLLIPITANRGSLPAFMVVLALVLFTMSVYRSPAVALMPDVTPKPLRSKGNAVINLMGAVGGILALGLIAVLVPKGPTPNYLPLFATIAALMVVCVAVLFFTVHERKITAKMPPEPVDEAASATEKLSPEKRRSLLLILASVFLWFFGYNAATTAFSKYANVYWGLEGGSFAYTLIIAQAAAIISYIPVGILATKHGRRKTILGGIIVLAAAFFAAIFFRTFSSLIFVLFALAGVGWATINVNSYPMVTELSRGSNVGKYTGYYYTASMGAQILTPILSGTLLQYVGYWTLFPYAALFVALSFVTMLFVKHGDAKPDAPASKLEAFAGNDD